MTQLRTDQTEELDRICNRLRMTPQHFRDFQRESAAREISSNVSDIHWEPVPPSRFQSFFTHLSFLWRINLDTLDDKLRSKLDALGIGYCYMIKRQGKIVHLGASGWAQLPNDGDIPWLFHIPMNIASISKFITAIATIRLLRDLNLPVTTPIAGYLPQYWTLGPGVGAITFENLMRQESGLGATISDSGPVTFQAAKQEIENGSVGTGAGMFDYTNINFTLLRIVFATLTGVLAPSFRVFPNVGFFPLNGLADSLDNDFWDFTSLTAYSNYVNDVVFTTAGIYPRDFEPPENAAKAYATPAATPGWVDGSTSAGAGTSGWYMSIGELMWVLGEFRRGGSIMGTWRAQKTMANQYGLDSPITTNAGPVYQKSGRWGSGSQIHDSWVFIMPGDVELAVFVNSVPAGTAPVPSYLNVVSQLITESIDFDLNVFRVP